MIHIEQSDTFLEWFDRLRDRTAKARIVTRLRRLSEGHPGDVKSVGDGVVEMRIHHGPGYRLYMTRRGESWVLLLCGGDKSSQDRDIRLAKQMMKELDD